MRNLVIIVTLLTLTACSQFSGFTNRVDSLFTDSIAKQEEKNFLATEKMLLTTKSYNRLILLYKKRLTKSDSVKIRLKLAKVYLRLEEVDLAAFYLKAPLKSKIKSAPLYVVEAICLYKKAKVNQALYTLNKALRIDPANGAAYNLQGIIYTSKHKYLLAKNSFNLAKINLYTEEKVDNNLALLSIIKGDYQYALEMLMPLYLKHSHNLNIKTNLLISLAKLKKYTVFRKVLGKKHSAKVAKNLYKTLQKLSVKGV